MSKERLEGIFKEYSVELLDGERILANKDMEWLYRQAEEKIQLEERFEALSNIHDRTLEENQRYKQVLQSAYFIIQLVHLGEKTSDQALKEIENLIIDSWINEADTNA